jgi:hypothetical protein
MNAQTCKCRKINTRTSVNKLGFNFEIDARLLGLLFYLFNMAIFYFCQAASNAEVRPATALIQTPK